MQAIRPSLYWINQTTRHDLPLEARVLLWGLQRGWGSELERGEAGASTVLDWAFLAVLHLRPKAKMSCITCTASGAAECSKSWKEFCGSCGKSGAVIWKQCGRHASPANESPYDGGYDVLCLSPRGINKNMSLSILGVFHLRRGCEELFWQIFCASTALILFKTIPFVPELHWASKQPYHSTRQRARF